MQIKNITLRFLVEADTGDICYNLLQENASIVSSDPEALLFTKVELHSSALVLVFEEDLYKAAKDAHGLGILTDWEIYIHNDYKRRFEAMEKPAFLFDGRYQSSPQNRA